MGLISDQELRHFITESNEVFDKIEAQLLELESDINNLQLIRTYHFIKEVSGFSVCARLRQFVIFVRVYL